MLIVTCAECTTQFQLDEARVPESGIRVRCSVCKHAFFVEHPDALVEASPDPIARPVEEALNAEAGEMPEATHDLEAADASAERVSGSLDDERDDESWEFSDGGRLSGARDASDRFEESFEAARDAVDDLLGSPEPDPELARQRVLGAQEVPPPEPDPAAEVDPVDSDAAVPLADDPWGVPAWSEGEDGLDEADPETAPSPDVDDLEREAGENGPGDPDLDPFADELSGPPEFGDLAMPGVSEPGEMGGSELEELEEMAGSELEEIGGLGLDEGDDAEPPAPGPLAAPIRLPSMATEPLPLGLGAGLEREPRVAVPTWLARTGSALGWGVVATLAAVVLWASAAPRSDPAASAGAQSLAGFEARGIEGRWVENAIVGPLYVVRGELRNPGSEAKAPGALLAVRLLDADGTPLDEAFVSLAPPLEAASLREAHPRELRSLREAAAQEIARTPVAPGASAAFEAVVEVLPEAARRFDLVVAPPSAARLGGS